MRLKKWIAECIDSREKLPVAKNQSSFSVLTFIYVWKTASWLFKADQWQLSIHCVADLGLGLLYRKLLNSWFGKSYFYAILTKSRLYQHSMTIGEFSDCTIMSCVYFYCVWIEIFRLRHCWWGTTGKICVLLASQKMDSVNYSQLLCKNFALTHASSTNTYNLGSPAWYSLLLVIDLWLMEKVT